MKPFTLIAFDRDIFQLQRYGGIRLYFNILNSTLISDHSLQVFLQNPTLASDVLPRVSNHKLNFFLIAVDLYRLLVSYVLSMLPFFGARKIYHATYYRNPFINLSMCPVVVTVHDMIHECFPEYFDPSYRSSIRRYINAKRKCIFSADAIIAISNATRDDLLRVYPQIDASRVHVIHHGSDHIPVDSKKHVSNSIDVQLGSRKSILYVGTREHYKGFGELLEAFSSFSKIYQDFKLICVGKPFSGKEVTLLTNLCLADKVISFQSTDSQLISLYQNAFVFIYPSWREGFGLPILEAMRSQCPVICSDIPSSREIAGKHALYFVNRDPNDLLARLVELVNMTPKSRHQRLSRAFDHASNFSWEKTARLTCNVYMSLLN